MAQGYCTIGDKTFDFTGYSPYNSSDQPSAPNAATNVTFTPLVTNPLSPGFELSGALYSMAGNNESESGDLYYNVSVTDGSANLIGVNEKANYTLYTAPVVPTNGGTTLVYADIGADNLFFTAGADAFQYAQQSQYGGSSPSYFYDSNGPQMFAPVSSGSGDAYFHTDAYGGVAKATISSVDYTFIENAAPAPTPEPGTLLLFGSGLASMLGFARRKIFRA